MVQKYTGIGVVQEYRSNTGVHEYHRCLQEYYRGTGVKVYRSSTIVHLVQDNFRCTGV
jgi:hypothetical protein